MTSRFLGLEDLELELAYVKAHQMATPADMIPATDEELMSAGRGSTTEDSMPAAFYNNAFKC